MYDPSYAEKLIAHMARGGSFVSFGATINVGKETLWRYLGIHPDFAEAKAKGEAMALSHWEQLGYGIVTGQIKTNSPAIWIFTMKCRFRKFGYNDSAVDLDEDDDDKTQDSIYKMPIDKLLKVVKS